VATRNKKAETGWAELEGLLIAALEGGEAEQMALERFLAERSGLPGPRLNLALVETFAGLVADYVRREPEPPIDPLEKLLDGWAALPLEDAPINQPREILPAAAVLSYGKVAVARPDWWPDEIGKVYRAATNSRWRVREIVAAALQNMLAADWPRTYAALQSWLEDREPLVIRAVVAAIAEPPLLNTRERGAQAVALQTTALDWLAALPATRRPEENVRVLRQALGYTVSVAVAAAPEPGLALLQKLHASTDLDLQWILKENLKKQRLQKLAALPAAFR
jgi:hypothetical protein